MNKNLDDSFTHTQFKFLEKNIKSIYRTYLPKVVRHIFTATVPSREVDKDHPNDIFICRKDDEWYLVRIEFHLTGHRYRGTRQEYGYYKCDQWDGLLELLKDKGIIK
jgi:hypothetical protein